MTDPLLEDKTSADELWAVVVVTVEVVVNEAEEPAKHFGQKSITVKSEYD